jgi:hypothetical protein
MFKMNYTRNKHVITNIDTNEVTAHPSINAAKRQSRELQKTGHTVRVIKPK